MVTKSGNQRKATKSKIPRVVATRKSAAKGLPKKASRPTKQSASTSKGSTVRGKTSAAAKQPAKKKTVSVSASAKKSRSVEKTAKPSTRKSPVVARKKTTAIKVGIVKTKAALKKTQPAVVKAKKETAPIKVEQVSKKPVHVRTKMKSLSVGAIPVIQQAMSSSREFIPYRFEPYSPVKGEHYMSDQQLAHFRQILNAWKLELMREVDNTISGMKASSADVLADLNDRATQEEAFNLELRTRDRERKLLKKIEDALQQIDEKEYGYCESCGIEIGIRRLEARPTAALCIDCKTLAEIREKRVAQ
jgi:DnaK suppressor protein